MDITFSRAENALMNSVKKNNTKVFQVEFLHVNKDFDFKKKCWKKKAISSV